MLLLEMRDLFVHHVFCLIFCLSASEISLTNTAASDVSWNLCSVAPAYVKVCNKKSDDSIF